MKTKITKLTALNVRALRETLTAAELKRVELGATTATFDTDPGTARRFVREAQIRATREHGKQGHPVQSLNAVVRKLAAQEQAAHAGSGDGPAGLRSLLTLDEE